MDPVDDDPDDPVDDEPVDPVDDDPVDDEPVDPVDDELVELLDPLHADSARASDATAMKMGVLRVMGFLLGFEPTKPTRHEEEGAPKERDDRPFREGFASAKGKSPG